MADKELVPDQRILSDIFPELPDIADNLCTVISNTFNTCTFRLLLATEPRPGFPADLLIRLETSGSHLAAVAELQHLAHLQIPHLVPATLAVGSSTDANGRQVEYSITPFLDGTTVLEEVWAGLDPRNQRSLVESIVVAVKELQEASVQSPDVHQIVQRAAKLQACEILDTGDEIAVQSAVDEIGVIKLSKSNHLMSRIVFCHNDLKPRNILVKRVTDGWYELAAIIDWELAGFFPFAYESGLKDTLLGSSNLWFSWYSLFKEQTATLLPKEDSRKKLIKVLGIIAGSKDSTRPNKVGFRVRTKWIKRERLSMSPDVRCGWVREDDASHLPIFTKEDNSNLEREVLKELGYI